MSSIDVLRGPNLEKHCSADPSICALVVPDALAFVASLR